MSESLLIKEIMELDDADKKKLLGHVFLKSDDASMLAMEWIANHNTLETPIQASVEDEEEEKESIEDNLAYEYWSRAQEIISEFNTYGGGPEDEEIEASQWIQELIQLVEGKKVSHITKMEIMDEALEEYFESNSGFDDALIELCYELCQSAEEWKAFASQLKANPSRWNNNKLMDIYLNKLGDESSYLELRLQSLNYGLDYWDLTRFYLSKDDENQALEVMEQGITQGEGRCTELFEHLFNHYASKKDENNLTRIVESALAKKTEAKTMLDKLSDYYLEQDNYAKAKQAMLQGLSHINRHGYHKEYLKLKLHLEDEDWLEIKEQFLLAAQDNYSQDYIQICIDEGMKETAVNALLEEANKPGPSNIYFDNSAHLVNQLQDEYPQQMINFYWEKACKLIPGGNRKTYRSAAGYLSRAKKIYYNILQDPEAWKERFNSLQFKFNNRPAFLDEVKHLR